VSVLVVRGDARALPLPDASVDLICTSPPYFALRAYQDNGEVYEGQIGSEPTPAAYVDSLIDCTREWMRVLKPSGSLWVNLGDKYAQATERSRNGEGERRTEQTGGLTGAKSYLGGTVQLDRRGYGVAQKSLVGLPWRYALRCIDELGLILRAEVIWSKVNGLPESVTDRVRRSHEQWFHMVKQPRYFSAVDEIREPHTGPPPEHYGRTKYDRRPDPSGMARTKAPAPIGSAREYNPLGKLPGSVWEIPTEPLQVPAELGIDHFAAFPTELPRRIILGWSPSGICTACGEGRRPVAKRDEPNGDLLARRSARNYQEFEGGENRTRQSGASSLLKLNLTAGESPATRIVGEACACPDTTAPTRPAVVLDPFGGTGTSALVAAALGRIGVSVDRSADYCRLAQWRTSDRGEIAKAMRVPKPPKPVDGQEALELFA
jgi:DNA modification methylase